MESPVLNPARKTPEPVDSFPSCLAGQGATVGPAVPPGGPLKEVQTPERGLDPTPVRPAQERFPKNGFFRR